MERLSAPGVAAQLFGADHAFVLIRELWPQAVGPELSRRTQVIALEGDTLRIGVPDASWRKGLLKMRGEILGRLWRLAGPRAPRRLSFAEGVRPRPREMPAPSPSPPPATPPAAVVAAAARIDDPDLRSCFLDSAARYLGRFTPSGPVTENGIPLPLRGEG